MIIGFTKQVQTVSESDVPSENGTFQIFINVSTQRVSEIEHVIQFRLLEAKSRATVVSFEFMGSFDFDARFGTDDQDLIVETYHLNPGESQIMSLVTEILNDVIPEGEECYSYQYPLVVFQVFEMSSLVVMRKVFSVNTLSVLRTTVYNYMHEINWLHMYKHRLAYIVVIPNLPIP